MKFKIQYGQIYSAIGVNSNFNMKNLKSNMDRFIGIRKVMQQSKMVI